MLEHVEARLVCDINGCNVIANIDYDTMTESDIAELGWYDIGGGLHACPKCVKRKGFE